MPDQPDPFELFDIEPEPDAGGADAGQAGGAGAEYVEVSVGSTRGGGRRWGLVLLGLLAVLVLVVGAGAFWVKNQIDPGNPGEEVALTIPTGSTTSDIASLLAEKDIITNATVFEWYLKTKDTKSFQAGNYDGLRRHSAMGDVIDVLDAGPVPPKDVTFLLREGLWASEARKLILGTFQGIDPAALDAALADTHPVLQPEGTTDLDGFLFPATYEVPEAQLADAQALVAQMVAAFGRVADEVGLPDATARLQGVAGRRAVTPYEALTVASLVESEAKVPEDRAKIARVIYNRLADGQPLGIDATVLFALQERKGTLTQSDLRVDSPYNTRVRAGLPPTPINSPGQASMEAAMNPAEGDWLYYVLTDTDGHHYFTDSYSDFQRAVRDAQDRGVF